jgi:hypothetical protein
MNKIKLTSLPCICADVADAKLKNNSVLTKTESEPADFMIECPRFHKLFGLYIKMLHSA